MQAPGRLLALNSAKHCICTPSDTTHQLSNTAKCVLATQAMRTVWAHSYTQDCRQHCSDLHEESVDGREWVLSHPQSTQIIPRNINIEYIGALGLQARCAFSNPRKVGRVSEWIISSISRQSQREVIVCRSRGETVTKMPLPYTTEAQNPR